MAPSSQPFRGKVVWITGASSGIGESLARVLAAEGAHLILSARRLPQLEALAAELGGEHLPLALDVADAAAIPAAAERALAWKGRIDVLVNNAGISQRAQVAELEMETVRRVMEVNFFSVVALTRAVLPAMQAQKDGLIVNISSVAGYVSTPLRSIYSASKHALRAFSDSLRAELHGTGVGVTVICPGYVRTGISRAALRGDGTQKGEDDAVIQRGMDPEEAARRIAGAMAARRREYTLGGREVWAIYLQRFVPGLVAWQLPRAAPK